METPLLGLPVGEDTLMIKGAEIPKQENCLESERLSENVEEQSPVDKYADEWEWLLCQDAQLKGVRDRAMTGDLRACRVRSICWRVLLGVLPAGKPESWLDVTKERRKTYSEFGQRIHTDPWTYNKFPNDNPLSQQEDSLWHQYFCDRELQNLIQQDVIRTFPGVDFFRDKRIQEMMVKILFCYARIHPDMCYRQGMHEILAPLLFVTHCDNQAFMHAKEQTPYSETIWDLLDPDYLEADSYSLFEKVMFAIQDSYRIENITPSNTGYFPKSVAGPMSENHVLQQLNWIKDNILARTEPELLKHLEDLDIPLPLFGIRWLRLLFGREFILQDLLVLWDAIFADGSLCQLVNYVVVSMLSAIKDQLLNSDYTSCLSLLMRYPTYLDVSYIIDNALYLKDPKIKHQPGPKPSQLPMAAKNPNNSSSTHMREEASSSVPSRSKKAAVKPQHLSESRFIDTSGIIDGFVFDDPSIVRNELKQCRALMALVKLKLTKYHEILEQYIPLENMPAQQALTGIHELCSLLNPHRVSRSPVLSVEIEPAYEAGETPSTPSNLPPPNTEVDMTTFKEIRGQPVESPDSLVFFVKS